MRLVFLSLLVFPLTLRAQQNPSPGEIYVPELQGQVSESFQSVGGLAGVFITVVQWAYTILFIIAIFYILLAAFTFITSAGDQEKIKTAKKQILYAVVGIAIALLSYAIIGSVRNALKTGLQ